MERIIALIYDLTSEEEEDGEEVEAEGEILPSSSTFLFS